VIHVVELFTMTVQTGLVRMHIRVIRSNIQARWTITISKLIKMKVGDDEDGKDTDWE